MTELSPDGYESLWSRADRTAKELEWVLPASDGKESGSATGYRVILEDGSIDRTVGIQDAIRSHYKHKGSRIDFREITVTIDVGKWQSEIDAEESEPERPGLRFEVGDRVEIQVPDTDSPLNGKVGTVEQVKVPGQYWDYSVRVELETENWVAGFHDSELTPELADWEKELLTPEPKYKTGDKLRIRADYDGFRGRALKAQNKGLTFEVSGYSSSGQIELRAIENGEYQLNEYYWYPHTLDFAFEPVEEKSTPKTMKISMVDMQIPDRVPTPTPKFEIGETVRIDADDMWNGHTVEVVDRWEIWNGSGFRYMVESDNYARASYKENELELDK